MKKLVRIAVFALVMAGAVTASFSASTSKVSVLGGGDPTPVCDPSSTTSCPVNLR